MSRQSPKYLTHEEDKELVKKAISGDKRAFSILAQKYQPIVFTAIKRRQFYLSDEDIEDMVMSVLGRAFISINQYDPTKSKFFTWIIACTHNHINSLPRKKKQITNISYGQTESPVERIADTSLPSDDIDSKSVVTLLRMLVDKLPEELSQVIKLKFFKELSNAEIAEILGIHETNVYYRVKKAREILRKWCDKEGLF